MNMTLSDETSVHVRVPCDCGRTIFFKPDQALTVSDLFNAAGHALYGCTCQQEMRQQRMAQMLAGGDRG